MSALERYIMRSLVVLTLLVLVAGPIVSMAQDDATSSEETESVDRPRGPRGNRGDRGDRWQGQRRFDPEQMRARVADRVKEMLEVNDEEWKIIAPLLKDVFEKQTEARWGGIRNMFTMGRRGSGREEQNADGETEALRNALDSKETAPADIKTKLKDFRKSRKAKEQELQKAREKLRKVLTVRQEAQLVLIGILD